MQERDGRKVAIYVVLVGALAALVVSLFEVPGPHHPSNEVIFRQIGNPLGLILLALSMLTQPKVAARYFMFASGAILVVVLVLQVRRFVDP